MAADDPLILPDVAAWRAWLDVHESASDGVWLLLAKKGTTDPTSISAAQALDEALCSGWIDGQRLGRDETTFLQRYTPRRARSLWSARNVQYIARLTAAGRMRPRGLAEVAAAQADGRWDRAYAGQSTIEVPPDLVDALAAAPGAAEAFAALAKSERYSVLHQVVTAATPRTRAARIARWVARLTP
ncbi:YdeI/OmpD-associated family protein [Cellulomonas taurus]|uniref:YdeI/OmpD-associated family protein n=1 Tax=Cellulomonas taurus TaxID=2729175 RepID=UPI00145C43D3|nr:YdeI/OmpD-associated family protein [Cellulomonas taurus]